MERSRQERLCGQGLLWEGTDGAGQRGTKGRVPEVRWRIWGLLWAADVILPSLCNALTASAHQYVGLLIAAMGIFIFTPVLMPSNHTSFIFSKKNL